jgi:hypothetical protein
VKDSDFARVDVKYREALSRKGDRPDKQVRKKLVAVSLFTPFFSHTNISLLVRHFKFFIFLLPRPLTICW